jgi:hypothetical protein
VRLAVNVTAVAEGDHYDQEYVVLDGVEDPIVADTHPVSGTASQRPGRWWPWVLGQEGYSAFDARSDFWIDLPQGPKRSRPDLDAV